MLIYKSDLRLDLTQDAIQLLKNVWINHKYAGTGEKMATDWGFLHMEPCNPCNIYTFHSLERFYLSVKVIRVWARIICSDFPPTVLRRIQIYLAACLNARSQAQAVEKLHCLQNKHLRRPSSTRAYVCSGSYMYTDQRRLSETLNKCSGRILKETYSAS